MIFIINAAKTFWIYLWAIFATCTVVPTMLVTSFFSPTGNLPFTISKGWAWIMIFFTGTKVEIKGKEKIEKSRSYIIIANHQSLFDIVAIVTTLGIQFRWIIKKELLKIPLFGWSLYSSKNIFIDRSDKQKSLDSIQKGIDRLPDGASVIFFAEGSRSSDGKVKKFKKGGFHLALEKSIPILPVTINGSRKILPKGKSSFSSGSIEVVVGDPIETSSYSQDNMDDLIKKTRDSVISNLNLDYPG